jgi:hypothetical protein
MESMSNARYPRSVPDEDHVAAIMVETGVSESDAWEILAIDRGDIAGDMRQVD